MATPHVAGVAALVISKGNATTPADVRTAIESTADDLGAVGRDNVYGYGIVDAAAPGQSGIRQMVGSTRDPQHRRGPQDNDPSDQGRAPVRAHQLPGQ